MGVDLQPVGIVVDPSRAQQGVAEINASLRTIPPVLKSVQTEAAKTTETLAGTGAASKAFAGDLALLDGYVKNFTRNLAAGNNTLAEAQRKYILANFGADAFAASQGRLAAASRTATSSLAATAQAATSTAGSLGTTAAASTATTAAVAGMTAGMLTTIAVVGLLALAVGGLLVVLMGLNKGIPLAAEADDFRVTFETIIGNAGQAKQTLKDLYDFADRTPFQIKDVVPAAQKLLAVGIGTDDLIKKLQMLGDIAAVSPKGAQAFEGLVAAYEKVRARNRITQEEVRSFINAGFNILPVLAKVRGESDKALVDNVRKGVVGWNDVEKAINKAAGAGGQYFGLMERRSATLTGLQSTFRDKWDALWREFGTGPADALRPVLASLISILEALIPYARSAGDAIGRAITYGFGILTGGQFWNLIWSGYKASVLDNLANTISVVENVWNTATNLISTALSSIKSMFLDLWENFSGYAFSAIHSVIEKIKGIPGALMAGLRGLAGMYAGTPGPVDETGYTDMMGNAISMGQAGATAPGGANSRNGGNPFSGGLTMFQRARMAEAEAELAMQRAYAAGVPAANTGRNTGGTGRTLPMDDPTGRGGGKKEKEYKEDIDAIITMQREIRQLQEVREAQQVSELEYARRLEDIKERAAGKLYDPQAWTQYGIEPWRAFQAERVRASKQADQEIKAGTLDYFASFAHGVEKALGSVQTMQQKLADFGEKMTNSLVNGLLTAFDAIISGSKTAGQAFREFAANFLKEIALMIIKAVILATLQMIIGAAIGKPVSFTTALMGNIGMPKNHGGGTIGSTRSGTYYPEMPRFHEGGWPGLSSNEIPIIAEKGEEIIPKGGKGRSTGTTMTFHMNFGGDTKEMDQGDKRGLQSELEAVIENWWGRQSRPGGRVYNAQNRRNG